MSTTAKSMLALMLAATISGCDDSGQLAPDKPQALAQPAPKNELVRFDAMAVVIDRETGCEYLANHGLTPRMSRYENGKQHQMGCYETIKEPTP